MPSIRHRPSLQAARQGVRAVAPILLGVAPFGLVAGTTPVEIGLGVGEALGFSALVFAGASQLAAMELLARDAPVLVAVATALVINLRMLMYAASLAPHLAHEPLRRRLLAAYLLTDQAYAVSIVRFAGPAGGQHRLAFYLGAGSALWVTWQTSTLVGAAAGGGLPEGLPLGFAVPLVFLALLVPVVTERGSVAAAVVGGGTTIALGGLPAGLGLLAGGLAGIVAGTVVASGRADAGPPGPQRQPPPEGH